MALALKQCKLDIGKLANPALHQVFAAVPAMFLIQDLAAPAVGVLAAKAGNDAAGVTGYTTGITSPAFPMTLQIVFAASYDGGTIRVTGYDQFNRPQTEDIGAAGAGSAGTTVQGTKIWKTITKVAILIAGATANTFTLQTGTAFYGCPMPLVAGATAGFGVGFCDGIAELFTFDTTVHGFKPNTTPNGAHDYQLIVPVDYRAARKMVVADMPNI